MKRGGYSCTMKDCPNISGRGSSLSFFRFPKDPDRVKLWLEKCDREINMSSANLYKNYKVCGDHFKSSMFLNNLKNRLQRHAIPEPIKNNNESFELSSKNNVTFNLSYKSKENTLSVECNIIKSNCDKQRLETGFSDKAAVNLTLQMLRSILFFLSFNKESRRRKTLRSICNVKLTAANRTTGTSNNMAAYHVT